MTEVRKRISPAARFPEYDPTQIFRRKTVEFIHMRNQTQANRRKLQQCLLTGSVGEKECRAFVGCKKLGSGALLKGTTPPTIADIWKTKIKYKGRRAEHHRLKARAITVR